MDFQLILNQKLFRMGQRQNYFLLLLLSLMLHLHPTQVEGSFVTKINNGFERLVVSIDDRLATYSTSSHSHYSSSSYSDSSGFRDATQDCRTVLQRLKDLIRQTSDKLYAATNGLTYFGKVSILLPSNWASSNCTGEDGDISTATYQQPNTADIHLTQDHPVYIDKPWTLQYGPCGTPGKKISIPLSFISSFASSDTDLKARLLVREWAKYRYGVFDENGYSQDERYPAEYIDQKGKTVVQTSCKLNRTCSNDEKCDDEVENAPTATKSLMSLPLDSNPNANEFCNEKTHIKTTPTKHQVLCNSKSIWEVFKAHEDFADLLRSEKSAKGEDKKMNDETGKPLNTNINANPNANNLPKQPPPVTLFSYATVKSHRIIFLLDRSNRMEKDNRWTNLRRNLYRTFQYLPNGVELGIVTYTNGSTTSLPLTVTSTSNRERIHGRIPLRPLATDSEVSCLSCALRLALKLMKSSSENVGPTTLVIINASPSSKASGKEWDKVRTLIDSTPLRLIVVSYGNDSSSELIQLGGRSEFYNVPEGIAGGNANLDQNEKLNSIFLQIIVESVRIPLNKVYSKEAWPNSMYDWSSKGEFTMEESLGRNTWITVNSESLGDVDGLQLISPTNKEFELPVQAEGLVYLKIPGLAESGVWTYQIKFYQNQSPRPVTIDVITESRRPESISVKFWNQVIPSTSPFSLASAEVVVLHAQVLQGELPVLNANVTAIVTLPGQDFHGQPNTVSVRLMDVGNGDPDITYGDGVYSAYFTRIGPHPGLFSVSLQIDDNNDQAVVPVHTNITRGLADLPTCCGSAIPHIATIPTGKFTRKMAGYSFQINEGVPFGDDPFPPGRITDLRVEKVVEAASEIKLSFTSPGGDFDQGKAARYEIRCYTSREALLNENFETQGILVHSSLTPDPENYGVRQTCSVGVPWSNEVFYYGIVSIDSALNRAKVSNLVSVIIKESPTSTYKIVDAWEDDALVSNLSSSRSVNSKNENVFQAGSSAWFRGLNEIELYFIIGGAGAFIFLVIIFILVLICVKKNKAKTSETPPAYHNIYVSQIKNGQPMNGAGKDGLNCCWENESNSTDTTTNHHHHNHAKIVGGIPAFPDPTSSYIPASALCSPQNGSIYREMYQGSASNAQDSSSVDSAKHSDGAGSGNSNETVHVTDGVSTPGSFYSHSHNHNQIGSNGGVTHLLNGGHLHPMSANRILFEGSNNMTKRVEYSPSDDDEGGFKSTGRQNDDSFHHKIIPMPGSSEYDSPSIMNGSTYGGSIMSIPTSNKKRTRHISFV